jgi:hypothetical protein
MPHLPGLLGTYTSKMSLPFQAIMASPLISSSMGLTHPRFLCDSHVEALPTHKVNIATLHHISCDNFNQLILNKV